MHKKKGERKDEVQEPNPEPSAPGLSPGRHPRVGQVVRGYTQPSDASTSSSSSRTPDPGTIPPQAFQPYVIDSGANIHVFSGDIASAYLRAQVRRERDAQREDPDYQGESNPWFLRIGEIARARNKWKKLLLRVERVLKLLAVGSAIQGRVEVFVTIRYVRVAEVQTEGPSLVDAEVQTDPPTVSRVRFVADTFLQIASTGAGLGGGVVRFLLRTPRLRIQILDLGFRFARYYIPAFVLLGYQLVPEEIVDAASRIFWNLVGLH